MPSRLAARIASLAFLLSLTSCSKEQPFRKETIPVRGQAVVDGQPPGSPLQIQCHDLKGMDLEHPSVTQAITAEDGTFALSTYESGDGVPPGDYVLTFSWQQFNTFSMSYGGPDKLKGRYKDPKKSEFKLSVKSGDKPIDLGKIELMTK